MGGRTARVGTAASGAHTTDTSPDPDSDLSTFLYSALVYLQHHGTRQIRSNPAPRHRRRGAGRCSASQPPRQAADIARRRMGSARAEPLEHRIPHLADGPGDADLAAHAPVRLKMVRQRHSAFTVVQDLQPLVRRTVAKGCSAGHAPLQDGRQPRQRHRPGSSAVTVHSAGGTFGCTIRRRPPRARGAPASPSRSTRLIGKSAARALARAR